MKLRSTMIPGCHEIAFRSRLGARGSFVKTFQAARCGHSAHRIPSLDGLRAIAILLVLFGHLIPSDLGLLLASFGVQVFFVLSGYLITSLLQQEHAIEGQIDLCAFYRRRSFRIFPAAFAYMVVMAVVMPTTRAGLPYAVTYTVSYHLNNIPTALEHLWSLSVEEQFYLLWPFAIWLGFRFRAQIAWTAMFCSGAFRLVCASTHIVLPSPPHYLFPGAMDALAAGCLAAIYAPALKPHIDKLRDSTPIAIALPVTAWTLNALLWSGRASALWGCVPILLAASLLLVVERRDRILNNMVTGWLGALSYSVYLWQQPFTVVRVLSPIPAFGALAVCAGASYFLIEKPMIAIGRGGLTVFGSQGIAENMIVEPVQE